VRLPSLRYLRTFQVAGKHLSFKDAADELAISASAVSHQIRNLETFLGVPLFLRLTRALEFTDAGRKYFDFLDSMFFRLESETQQLWSQFGRNIVRLGVPPFFASQLLLPRLHSYQSDAADTDIRVTTRPSAINNHPPETDVSILLGNAPWPDCTAHRLFGRRMVVACSQSLLAREKIGSYGDLDGKTLIVHDSRPDAWKDWASTLGIRPPAPGRLLRSDSMSAIASAAKQGLGFALISWPLGRACFGNGRLVRVFDEEVETGEAFHLAYRKEDAERPDIVRLRSWVLEHFQNYA